MLFDVFDQAEKLYSLISDIPIISNGINMNLHNMNRREYEKEQASLKKELNYNETIQLERDSKRQVSKSEKEKIWNNSTTHYNFDPDYFRKDILGNVCVKNLCVYRSFSNRNQISYQYEHIRAYSNGGKTNTQNVCLLNSGINNMKRSEEIFTINFITAFGYCKYHGISFEDLESELNNNIHLVCDKYNIYFYKNGTEWTVKEYAYNNQYLNKHEDKENGNKIGEKIMDGKNFLYDNLRVISLGTGISVCIFIGYYTGTRSLQRKMYEAYKKRKKRLKELNDKLKLLKYEIEEINDEIIYKRKKIILDNINQEIYELNDNIRKLAKELNLDE